MSRTVPQLLAKTTVRLRRGPYVLGKWPLAMESAVHAGVIRAQRIVSVVMRDDLEVTALVEESALSEMPPARKVEGGWSLLTLDTVMEWQLVGVMAEVSSALAAAGVPLGAFAAFSRDHIIVQAEHLGAARDVLARLCAGVEEAT